MDLLQRFAAGDLEAFESLFRQYQGEVYRWIIRIVRNSATAEDLTVETFWRMYRVPSLTPPGEPSARGFAASPPTPPSIIFAVRAAKFLCPTISPPPPSSRLPSNSSFAAKFFPPLRSSRLRFAPSSCSPWWRKNPMKISLGPWTFPKTP
jgi:Sigma-70 region 2